MRRKHGRKKTTKNVGVQMLAMVCSIILLVSLVYQGGRWLEARNAKPEARGDYRQRESYEEIVDIDGVSYAKRKGITSVLLMGVDQTGETVSGGFRNGGQSDFLRLLVLDSQAHTATQLQIDRDTMTPITVLGVLGNRTGMRTAQICLSHGFGDGKEQSCELTVDAVENLLLGTPIDFYLSMNLDGISALNDWVGGIEVTLEDDFSEVDPVMTKGTTLTLVGDQAETYVRSRMQIGVGTNEARMKRQNDYIQKLGDQLQTRFHESKQEITSLYDTMEPYLVTDMAKGRLINEVWAARDYMRALVGIDGKHQIGSDGFMEYIVDQNSVKNVVLDLFYEKVEP